MTAERPDTAKPVANRATARGFHQALDGGACSYVDPIVYADYSDPDRIRHGAYFHLVASSFPCTPGSPILRSRDLVNWDLRHHRG